MITPFKNGDVDYDAADLFAHHLVDAGVHGLVVGGTTGEGPSLTISEKARLVDIVASAAAGRVPVFLGVEGANTQKVLTELAEVGSAGIDGYLVSAPSYVRPSQEGIYRHFRAIADFVKRPVILYDVPSRTAATLEVATVHRLVESGGFQAIKACGLSAPRLKALIDITDLQVMCGDDDWILEALELGGSGAISASAQVAPRRFVQAYSTFEHYGADAAWKRFHILGSVIDSMFSEPNPGPVKAALALQNWCRDELRLPMTTITDDLRVKLSETLQSLHALWHRELLCADKSSK